MVSKQFKQGERYYTLVSKHLLSLNTGNQHVNNWITYFNKLARHAICKSKYYIKTIGAVIYVILQVGVHFELHSNKIVISYFYGVSVINSNKFKSLSKFIFVILPVFPGNFNILVSRKFVFIMKDKKYVNFQLLNFCLFLHS